MVPLPQPATGDSRPPATQPVLWVIAAALVVIATCMVLRLDDPTRGQAMAQPVSSAGARGVFAFTGPLSKNSNGVFMVDVDTMTIWVYEYLPQNGCLRLAAARTWQYDRYLPEFNVCDLEPDAVEKMVEEARRRKLQSSESQMP